MKLKKIPIYGSGPPLTDYDTLSEFDLVEVCESPWDLLNRLRRLGLWEHELPGIVVEAAAFRQLCVDHETMEFGWCPYEIEDPWLIPKTRHFLERLGHTALAGEVRNVERQLEEFGIVFQPEPFVSLFVNPEASPKRRQQLNDAFNGQFYKPTFVQTFGDDIWRKVATEGIKAFWNADIFNFCTPETAYKAALRDVVDSLPDYENRGTSDERGYPTGKEIFHRLLLTIGERYFADESIKVTTLDGGVFAPAYKQRYDFDVTNEAQDVHELSSTKKDWLCCRLHETIWLVDKETGEKVSSIPRNPPNASQRA